MTRFGDNRPMCSDHRYEAGAYGVCRRCGGERPKPTPPAEPSTLDRIIAHGRAQHD